MGCCTSSNPKEDKRNGNLEPEARKAGAPEPEVKPDVDTGKSESAGQDGK